jgi:uncharacterized OB-fold protein
MAVLKPQTGGIPLPVPTMISKPYWDGCARGELMYQRCTSCGRSIFNPAPICRWCTSNVLEWVKSEGRGSVYSWTVVWRPSVPEFEVPYVPAIIDVDEGFQMIGNIIGCEPTDVSANMRVAVEFHPIGGNFLLPYFAPKS